MQLERRQLRYQSIACEQRRRNGGKLNSPHRLRCLKCPVPVNYFTHSLVPSSHGPHQPLVMVNSHEMEQRV